MIFPPGPIIAPIISLGTLNASIRGVCGLKSGFGAAIVSMILFKICKRPPRACSNAWINTSYGKPSTLMSI